MVDRLKKLFEPSYKKGWNTGFKQLDENGGLPKGALTIVASGTGVGKSLFASQILINLARDNIKSVYIELENGYDITTQRLLRNWCQLDETLFKPENYEFGQQQLAELEEHISLWYPEQLELESVVDSIMDKLDIYKSLYEVFLIDNLESLSTKIKAHDIYKEQSELVKRLQEFANTYNKSIILTHHIRKDTISSKKLTNGEMPKADVIIPSLENIKGSGNVTNFAHSVWGLVRDKDSKSRTDRSITRLRIVKNRTGLSGEFMFYLDEDTLSFKDRPILSQQGYFNPY